MKRYLSKIAGFGVVGVIAFCIDFGVLVLLKEFAGFNPVIAAAISFIVSLLFNYWASMRFVFSHREDMSRSRELAVFVVLSIVGLGLNEATMWLGTEYLSIHYMGVKIVATALVMVWNFWSRQRWLDAGE